MRTPFYKGNPISMRQPKAELNKKQCSLNIINQTLINEAFFVVCVIKCASQTQYNPMNFVTFLRQLLFLYPSKLKILG
ncbi:hypothetical protein AL552_13220 [Vibrio diabolicus]|nr:hypothetical protein AL552_13220 [Vibrio diabolicus]